MEEISKKHSQVPNNMAQDGLSPREQLVYAVLHSYNNPENKVFPSLDTLAKRAQLSVPTIRDSLKKLEESGYIKIEKTIIETVNSLNKSLYDFALKYIIMFFEKIYRNITNSKIQTIVPNIYKIIYYFTSKIFLTIKLAISFFTETTALCNDGFTSLSSISNTRYVINRSSFFSSIVQQY